MAAPHDFTIGRTSSTTGGCGAAQEGTGLTAGPSDEAACHGGQPTEEDGCGASCGGSAMLPSGNASSSASSSSSSSPCRPHLCRAHAQLLAPAGCTMLPLPTMQQPASPRPAQPASTLSAAAGHRRTATAGGAIAALELHRHAASNHTRLQPGAAARHTPHAAPPLQPGPLMSSTGARFPMWPCGTGGRPTTLATAGSWARPLTRCSYGSCARTCVLSCKLRIAVVDGSGDNDGSDVGTFARAASMVLGCAEAAVARRNAAMPKPPGPQMQQQQQAAEGARRHGSGAAPLLMLSAVCVRGCTHLLAVVRERPLQTRLPGLLSVQGGPQGLLSAFIAHHGSRQGRGAHKGGLPVPSAAAGTGMALRGTPGGQADVGVEGRPSGSGSEAVTGASAAAAAELQLPPHATEGGHRMEGSDSPRSSWPPVLGHAMVVPQQLGLPASLEADAEARESTRAVVVSAIEQLLEQQQQQWPNGGQVSPGEGSPCGTDPHQHVGPGTAAEDAWPSEPGFGDALVWPPALACTASVQYRGHQQQQQQQGEQEEAADADAARVALLVPAAWAHRGVRAVLAGGPAVGGAEELLLDCTLPAVSFGMPPASPEAGAPAAECAPQHEAGPSLVPAGYEPVEEGYVVFQLVLPLDNAAAAGPSVLHLHLLPSPPASALEQQQGRSADGTGGSSGDDGSQSQPLALLPLLLLPGAHAAAAAEVVGLYSQVLVQQGERGDQQPAAAVTGAVASLPPAQALLQQLAAVAGADPGGQTGVLGHSHSGPSTSSGAASATSLSAGGPGGPVWQPAADSGAVRRAVQAVASSGLCSMLLDAGELLQLPQLQLQAAGQGSGMSPQGNSPAWKPDAVAAALSAAEDVLPYLSGQGMVATLDLCLDALARGTGAQLQLHGTPGKPPAAAEQLLPPTPPTPEAGPADRPFALSQSGAAWALPSGGPGAPASTAAPEHPQPQPQPQPQPRQRLIVQGFMGLEHDRGAGERGALPEDMERGPEVRGPEAPWEGGAGGQEGEGRGGELQGGAGYELSSGARRRPQRTPTAPAAPAHHTAAAAEPHSVGRLGSGTAAARRSATAGGLARAVVLGFESRALEERYRRHAAARRQWADAAGVLLSLPCVAMAVALFEATAAASAATASGNLHGEAGVGAGSGAGMRAQRRYAAELLCGGVLLAPEAAMLLVVLMLPQHLYCRLRPHLMAAYLLAGTAVLAACCCWPQSPLALPAPIERGICAVRSYLALAVWSSLHAGLSPRHQVLVAAFELLPRAAAGARLHGGWTRGAAIAVAYEAASVAAAAVADALGRRAYLRERHVH